MIPYGHQWIDENDIRAAVNVLRGDWMTQGPTVQQFEEALTTYCGASYAVAVSSGTAALHSAYVAAGIGAGDEVITTPLTFAATASMIAVTGARVVFADIEEDTLNINPEEIEKKITTRTKAIAAVDFAGHPCAYGRLRALAKQHSLFLIEDAAHALGALYHGERVGSLADITTFSFHPVKHITTGEGGAIITNQKEFSDRCRVFRHHGAVKKPENGEWYYEIEAPGYNYRITDFQCALGLAQLKRLDAFIARRRLIAQRYNDALQAFPSCILPIEKEGVQSSYHLYILQLRLEQLTADRRKIFDALRARGLGVQVHYMPLHLQPFFQRAFGYRVGDFPNAEQYYARAITLPLFPKMTDNEVQYVITTVVDVLCEYTK